MLTIMKNYINFRKSVIIILTYCFVTMCIVQHGYYPMQLLSISIY